MNVKEDDETLLKVYQFEIEDTPDGEAYEKKLKVLQELVNSGNVGESSKWNAGQPIWMRMLDGCQTLDKIPKF